MCDEYNGAVDKRDDKRNQLDRYNNNIIMGWLIRGYITLYCTHKVGRLPGECDKTIFSRRDNKG